jgi:hypothetical protein
MKANLKFCAKLGKFWGSFVVGWKFSHGFMRIYVLNVHLNGIKFEVLRNTLLTKS